MSVGRICVREVDLAERTETVWQAAERMRQRVVGTLVILDRDRRPIGILTDRDLVERVLADGKNARSTTVDEVMSRNPKTVTEEAPIEHALSVMRAHRMRRLPVVGRDGTLVGLLSLDDVLMLLAEEFAVIGGVLRFETPQEVLSHGVLGPQSP